MENRKIEYMIRMYSRKTCNSSQKAINWLKEYKQEVNILDIRKITRKDLLLLLYETDKGFNSIIKNSPTTSKRNKKKIQQLEELTFNEGMDFLLKNSELLKTPLILEGNKVLVGYHVDEIRKFLPKTYRRQTFLRSKNTSVNKIEHELNGIPP